MFVTKMKKKMSRVVDRVVPCPLSISLSLSYLFVVVQITCSTSTWWRWTLFHLFLQKKKTPSKPSSYPLHPLNLIILFYVIFFIFFFYFQFLSFCLLFSYHSLSPLSKSTACSYRMHLILPIVPHLSSNLIQNFLSLLSNRIWLCFNYLFISSLSIFLSFSFFLCCVIGWSCAMCHVYSPPQHQHFETEKKKNKNSFEFEFLLEEILLS